MKRIILVCLAALGMSSTVLAGGRVLVGGGVFPLQITGVQDIAISDWETYGLGPLEGRVVLPLGKAATSGVSPQLALGYVFDVTPKIHPVIELNVPFNGGSATVVGFDLGCNFDFFRNERLGIYISPKVGYASGSVSFGNAKVIPGKTAPVIIPNLGTVKDGDKVEATLSAVTVQGVLGLSYQITPKLGLDLSAGYATSFANTFKIKAGDVELKKDSKALVKNDGTSTQAGIDPQVSVSGAMATLALTWLTN